ncbi:hypothetical protein [Breoghania corrubedonensis]|uniref:hypothetical protein n=1 Tax=Breoghania corrubedonensis TaxID=665038 RepID=UPI0011B21C7D|nr:hypothetical protein [Breoghania corrubedonensis]
MRRRLETAFIAVFAAGMSNPQAFASDLAEKRPYASHRPSIEIGIGYDHRPGGMRDAPALSVPFRAESYYSDSVDLVFSGWAGYSRHTGEDAFGLLAAPGFAYWFDGHTRVTTQVRTGFEHFNESGTSVFVLGADIRGERFVALHPERPYPEQDMLVPAVKFGGLSRMAAGRSDYSYLFAGLSLAYERGFGAPPGAPFHLRGKVMAEGEVQMDGDGGVTAYTTGLLELRAVKANGRLIVKGEIGVTSDFNDFTKVGMTLSRGF